MRKRYYTFKEFLLLSPIIEQKPFAESLCNLCPPKFLCEVAVPEDLGAVSYGVIADLGNVDEKNEVQAITDICRIVLGVSEEQVMNERVDYVLGFTKFVRDEVDKINKMFADISIKPTPEEERAGIAELSFGAFGTMDWYSRRMGITNQNDVRDISWVRIYRCMQMDNAAALYERRLNKIYASKR